MRLRHARWMLRAHHTALRPGRDSASATMKKLRTLVVVHASLVPPESLEGYSEKEVERVAHGVRRREHAARQRARSALHRRARQPDRAAQRDRRLEAGRRVQPAGGIRRHRHVRPARRRVSRAAAPALHGLQSARPAAVARQVPVQAAARLPPHPDAAIHGVPQGRALSRAAQAAISRCS